MIDDHYDVVLIKRICIVFLFDCLFDLYSWYMFTEASQETDRTYQASTLGLFQNIQEHVRNRWSPITRYIRTYIRIYTTSLLNAVLDVSSWITVVWCTYRVAAMRRCGGMGWTGHTLGIVRVLRCAKMTLTFLTWCMTELFLENLAFGPCARCLVPSF